MTSLCAHLRWLKLQESNRKVEEAHQLLQGTKSECQELLLGRRVGIGQDYEGQLSCCCFWVFHLKSHRGTCSEPRSIWSISNYLQAIYGQGVNLGDAEINRTTETAVSRASRMFGQF